MLSTALADWNSSEQGSYAQLAQMTSARGFSQTSHHGKTLDIQRGIVVLATNQFVILQSANGSLHLWLVSGGTKFQNVSGTTAGTAALTASTSATQQAMQSGNMIPATTLLAGSPTTAAAMLTPTAEPQTVTVQVAGTDLTVTVTVTRSTAAVTQTATTPANASPVPMTSTFAMNAWQPANSLARGDLAVIVGTRSHQTLHAQLVLFSPLTTSAVGGTTGRGLTKLAAKPSTAPTHW
jgi:ribosomal protein S11